MIKVVAIDDEPLALRQLGLYISKVPDLELLASCPSATAARPYVEQADLLLVDINMPDVSGLDFVRSLENAPLIVFTTAYSQYAIEGYKVSALDYLLKPFSFQDFEETIGRVRKRLGEVRSAGARKEDREELLLFRKEYRTIRVDIRHIRYVESMSEYIKIWMDDSDQPIVVLYRLKRLASQLPSDRFLQVHRSYLVKLSEIREIGRDSLILDGGRQIPIGDLYRPALMDYLQKLKS